MLVYLVGVWVCWLNLAASAGGSWLGCSLLTRNRGISAASGSRLGNATAAYWCTTSAMGGDFAILGDLSLDAGGGVGEAFGVAQGLINSEN